MARLYLPGPLVMRTLNMLAGRLGLVVIAAATAGGCAEPIEVRPGASAAVAMPPASQPTADVDWSGYAAALGKCVGTGGRVDYFRLSKPPFYPALEAVYGQIARTGPRSAPTNFARRADRLAYYINAHNLLALLALAPHFGVGKVDPLRVGDLPAAPETGYVFTVDGERTTLNGLRLMRIEPLLEGDPRPLLALCAGRRNDPPLRAELYEAGRLDEQLADQLRRVLRSEPWCRIDHAARRVLLPAGVALHSEYYWKIYEGSRGGNPVRVGFVSVLLSFADERGRAWLNRAVGYDVGLDQPGDQFNNKALLPALEE